MEHGASGHLEDESHMEMTIKTEVEEAWESTAYIEIEVNMKVVKKEPGTVEFGKTEPGLSVKEVDVEGGEQDSQQSNKVTQLGQRAQSQLYKCDKCVMVAKSKSILNSHYKRVHATESHKCTECNKEYKCKKYLLNHISYVHSKQHECAVCKAICKSKRALYYHLSRHHRRRSEDSQARVYICDYCQKTFKARFSIQVHIASVHEKRSYKCSQCNRRFKCKQYLMMHTAKVHIARSQVCNVCGKSVRPSNLRQHMLNMHSDAQLQCKLCGKSIKSKQYLRRHVNNFHGQSYAASDYQQWIKASSTPVIIGSLDEAASSVSQVDPLHIKKEPGDAELDIGPTVLQHMDSHFRTSSASHSQIIDEIKIEPNENKQVIDDNNRNSLINSKPNEVNKRHIIAVRLNKTPKTSTERSREFRARMRLLKEKQQNLDLCEELPSQNDLNIGPSSSKKNEKTSAERTRRWRERKGLLPKSPNKQTKAKTVAERSRDYRRRKKNMSIQSNIDHDNVTTASQWE